MVSDQMCRTGLHGFKIKVMAHMPHKATVMCDRRGAGDEAKEIAPLTRGKTGVKIIGHMRSGQNRDGQGAQMMVQRAAQAVRIPHARKIHCRHLPRGMHPRIRASRGGNGVGPRLQPRKRRLDGSLNRGLPLGLPLPALERTPVIIDFQRITWHGAWFNGNGRRFKPGLLGLRFPRVAS